MKKLQFVLLVVVVVAVVVPLEAQVGWGIRAGVTEGEPMIGGELVIPVMKGDLVLNPNLEFTPEVFLANADVHYDFDISPATSFWIGAGLAFVKPDDRDEAAGVNLLGGIGSRRGRVFPYAQAKLTAAGDAGDFASVAVGVRF